MSKIKIIIGGVAVVAIAATAAHFAAPSFFENQFRAHLTDPKSDLRGEFDNFHLSLLEGTMSATNVSLRTRDGVTLTGIGVVLEQVNWFTLLNANPFSDTLAGLVLVENGQIDDNGAQVSSPAISLSDLRMIKKDGTITYGAQSGELSDMKIEDGMGTTATADLVALENVTDTRFDGLTLRNLNMETPTTDKSLSVETASLSDCGITQSLQAIMQMPDKPFEFCSGLSGTGVKAQFPPKTKVTIASFGLNKLSAAGVQDAVITDIEATGNDKPLFTAGEISLTGLTQTLRADAFNNDKRLDAREWQHLMDNLSIDAFSVTDMSAGDDEISGKWDSFGINDLKDGELGKFALSGLQFELLNNNDKPVFKLGNFEVSKLSLSRLQKITDLYNAPKDDPEAPLEKFKEQTVADLGLIMPPMAYDTFSLKDLSISGTNDAISGFRFGIDQASSSLADPIRLEGSGTAFAKTARSSYQGMYLELADTSPIRPMIAAIMGLDDFKRLTLNGKMNVAWDDQSGIYTYDLEDTSIEDIGSISLSAKIGNLTPEIMAKLNATRLGQSDELQQIALGNASFNGAHLEIKGDKLLKMVLRLVSTGNGQTAEDLQLATAMILMQTQEKFAQYPRLSNALTELVDWFSNPQHLIITLAPDAPVPFGVLAAGGMQPPATADLLGLTIQANENAK